NDGLDLGLDLWSRGVFHHHSGDAAAELDGVVGAAVPRVDLAHRGEVEPGDRRPYIGDVARMVDGRNRLGVVRAPEPAVFQPAGLEIRVAPLEGGQETLDQL